jgi:hypothetical protein
MSYPTVKFFPPWSSKQEQGTLRTSYDKSLISLKRDTINYIESIRKQTS